MPQIPAQGEMLDKLFSGISTATTSEKTIRSQALLEVIRSNILLGTDPEKTALTVLCNC